ncbi:MAG: carboxymuconolactone decarboxylase family protein [Sphingomonadales bacterium]|nr:carboxymuconolactone decarboxylase family protein [Sphingomonadales bacterium]MDE2567325.1 carboxymuconolactone decarboxylase family protein [Sphingomonadales bacterium]
MRLAAPRIAPVAPDRLDAEQADVLAPVTQRGQVLNIFRTLVHAPDALRAFLAWGSHVLSKKNSLDARLREIVILRTGFLCGSGYEFTQHTRIGLNAGITADEIEAIKAGPSAAGWSALDRAALSACDELVRDHFVTDATWAALAGLGERGRMDLVFTVGQYTQVSMMLNSFGVQLDEGQQLDPALDRRAG